MKYIRRQNLNQQNALDKKVLIKPNGDIEFNPTSSVTVTNWTSDINFDVNISAWASGTIRSLILGEQVG